MGFARDRDLRSFGGVLAAAIGMARDEISMEVKPHHDEYDPHKRPKALQELCDNESRAAAEAKRARKNAKRLGRNK